jgi:hypothetical protein
MYRRGLAGFLALSLLAQAVPSGAQSPSSPQRAQVMALSMAYIGSAIFGAHIALRDSVPGSPFGIHLPRSVHDEFYLGSGTGLSPGVPMLLIQAALTGMTAGRPATSRRATHALAVEGALYFGGQLCEPTAWRVLGNATSAPRDRLAVVVGNIVLPALMTITAVHSLK